MTAIEPNISTTPRERTTSRPLAPSATSPLRVAIVGAGKMGQHHARAIARLPDRARVVAVVDPAPAAREAMLRICPDAAGYATIQEMVANAPVDVVHICAAPQLHDALALAAIEAGCHVYVEKPFATSVAAAERLAAAARAKRVELCAGHQLLFEAPSRRMVELLPAVGRVVHVESFFSFRTVRRSPGGRAPLRADLQLLDILPHPVYLLLHALEEAAPEGRTELVASDVGPAGTVHALVRRGPITGQLVVTLEGRPVESYLRVVGTNGVVHADFVRGTVQRLIGPGTSGIDKALNPFRLGRQLVLDTAGALTERIVRRQRSYPGLREIFESFYASIRRQAPAPMSTDQIVDTVRIWEQLAHTLAAGPAAPSAAVPTVSGRPRDADAGCIAVTGGTGFLGREVVKALVAQGSNVRVIARRAPPAWEQIAGVEYRVADLAEPISEDLLRGGTVLVHCAAETAGSWEEHQRNSIDTTEAILRAAAAAGVTKFIHVSSLAVLSSDNGRQPLHEDSPLEPNSRGRGPYVWGKLESERRALALAGELGVAMKIVRPGALVDYRSFEPPGRLGKRLGNIFVAVGSPRDRLGVADVDFAGRTIAWMAHCFASAPGTLHLLAPELPSRRELVSRLQRSNPDLSVIWLPMLVLKPLSWCALGAQKVLRPGKPAVNVAKVFAPQRYDTSRIAGLAPQVQAFRAPARSASPASPVSC